MKKYLLFIYIHFFIVSQLIAQRSMESLDRGLVAVKVSSGVFLSWRILGTDPSGIGFNIYRGTTKVNATPITGASNLSDAAGTTTSTYSVRPVVNNVEQAIGGSCSVWATQGLTVQLQQPAGGTTPDGVTYTYSPNDCSVGDVDGDGQWEIILKWDPSNSKDNSQSGYTGDVFLDCYELSGSLLWRIDLGKNIRAGAHYTQFLVGDYNSDGKAEVACKTAPGTKDGTGIFLRKGPAANDDDTFDGRNSNGYILTGNEYLTVFNGQTGAELATATFNPVRGTVSSWGDNYGNRVDRFLATNAYLDGKKPSMVFQRGYYTRMAVTAWDWDGTTLSQRWYYNGATSGTTGFGQGNHNLSCGDIDGDGFDEIIEGSCAIDHNGTLMYRTGLGHGDAIHLSDLDLDNPGLEVWTPHEDTTVAYGYELHDAKTGKILWGENASVDVGRGMAADVDANSAGFEMWSSANSNTYSNKGAILATSRPSYNFRIYWDADVQDELLDGNKLEKWNGSGSTRLITFTGNSCNSTKATPNLCADILGDWREEVILHDGVSKLYIYTTTIPTTNRMYTLMHDPVYRNAISWQNTAYNQPPHLGFFLGKGTDKAPIPNITLVSIANKTPTINITSPATGSKYTGPTSISFTVSATDIDGTISKVEYYNGLTLIGTSTTSPFSYTWTNVIAGTYIITAKATDNQGAVGTSTAITITVAKVPYTIFYVYDGSGNYSWDNVNSWSPNILPQTGDTGIVRIGEAQLNGITVNAEIRLETSGTIKVVNASTISKLIMQGGSLSVYTGSTGAPLTSAISVANDSKINVGSTNAAILTLNGTITGSGNLEKTGVGSLLINSIADTYKGTITASAGTITVASASGLGLCGAYIKAGATLNITVGATCNSLIVDSLGTLNLNQNITVQVAEFGKINLLAGTYTATNLPYFISGTGTLTVQKSLIVSSSPSNGSITLTASSGTSYNWFNGTTSLATTSTYKPINSGNYTVKATATNGCIVTSIPVSIQTLPLIKGWNLISLNLRSADTTIATLFNGVDVQEIKTMDAFWRKGQNVIFNSLTKLTIGNAYLVNMNVTGYVSILGVPINQKFQIISNISGWQLIGCPFQTSSALSVYFTTTNCKSIKNFEGFWIPSGTANSIQNIDPGKGYFIKK